MATDTDPPRSRAAARRSALVAIVLAAALIVAGCGDGSTGGGPAPEGTGGPAGSAAADRASVNAENIAFTPSELRVVVGTTVTVTNNDGVSHTFTADDGSWDSGTLGAGKRFTRRFTDVGTFTYHCEIHSSMQGTIVVTEG